MRLGLEIPILVTKGHVDNGSARGHSEEPVAAEGQGNERDGQLTPHLVVRGIAPDNVHIVGASEVGRGEVVRPLFTGVHGNRVRANGRTRVVGGRHTRGYVHHFAGRARARHDIRDAVDVGGDTRYVERSRVRGDTVRGADRVAVLDWRVERSRQFQVAGAVCRRGHAIFHEAVAIAKNEQDVVVDRPSAVEICLAEVDLEREVRRRRNRWGG